MLKAIATALLALALPAASGAQTPPSPPPAAASPALAARADGLVSILAGSGDYRSYFAPTFRAKVSRQEVEAIADQLRAALGKPVGIESVTPEAPDSASLRIGYERGIATARITIAADPPNAVTGLTVTGSEPRDDSVGALSAAFRSLPGQSAFGIYELRDSTIVPVAELNGEQKAPMGSSFKLWLLAEAARQVASGERRWSDVIALRHSALDEGTLSAWPVGTPMTLQTLATLMTGQSDNSAADTLLAVLGRAKVDAMVSRIGVADADATLPILSTSEAASLKLPRNAGILAQWRLAANPDERRSLLARHALALALPIEPTSLPATPVATDSAEWFASPRDEAATLDWLRRNGGDAALGILSVGKGASADAANRFAYIGYKGGSETGVIAANYLVRRPDGRWYAVSGSWRREDAGVNAITFFGLMNRALIQAALAR